MMSKKNLFLVFFLIINSQSAYPEYLFYKIDRGDIRQLNQADHNEVYPKIIRYTFPTNTNPLIDYNELNSEEKQEMYHNEHSFLQKKIGNNYGIQFIPTTLYELLVLKLWTQLELKIPTTYNNQTIYRSFFGFPESSSLYKNKENFLTLALLQNPIKEQLRSFNEVWRKDAPYDDVLRLSVSFEIYKNLNELPEVQAFHLLINNKILEYLNSQNLHVTDLEDELVSQAILHTLCDYFKQMQRHMMLAFSRVKTEEALCEGITNKELLEKIINLEYAHEKKEAFILFRGTHKLQRRGGKIDSTVTLREQGMLPASLSYGNSLYAALFGDDCLHMGAMAYHYIQNGQLGYAVLIDKLAYAQQNLQNLFHIPPLTTLVGLASQGEFFHTRTKALVPDDDQRLCGIWFFSGTGPYHIPTFLKNKEHNDLSLHEQEFSEYLVDNMVILNNETGIIQDDLYKQQLTPLEETKFIYTPRTEDSWNELNYHVPAHDISTDDVPVKK